LILTFAALAAGLLATAAASPKPKEAVQSELTKLGRGIDDVSLFGASGRKVLWREFNGQPRAVFFGFTNCPVVCPVTVWEVDSAMIQIGTKAQSLKIIFVTLDPARDTPAVLKSYFSGFKDRVIPLTGKDADIQRLAKAFEVTSVRVDTGKGSYSLDHTAAVFLLDRKGQVVDTLAFGTPRGVMVARLKKLLEGPN
jgi:protein SCO1/2